MTSVEDSHGPSLEVEYDTAQRVISETLTPKSIPGQPMLAPQVIRKKWDDRDRLIEFTDAENKTTKIQYDKVAIGCGVVDKPSMITDPAGRKTYLYYDLRQRISRQVDADGNATRFTYNLRGDLTSVTDAENHQTRFYFDQSRRMTRRERDTAIKNPDGSVGAATEITRFVWDQADRLTREEKVSAADPSLIFATTLAYDSLGRVLSKTLTKELGGQVIETQDDSHYTYQPQLDAVKIATANNGVSNLSFDSEALPPFSLSAYSVSAAESGNPLNLIEGSFLVNRHVTGEMSSVIDQAGTRTVLSADYDPAGRLSSIGSSYFSPISNLSFSQAYDGFGRLSRRTASTGLVGNFAFDSLNRVTHLDWSGPGLPTPPPTACDPHNPMCMPGMPAQPPAVLFENLSYHPQTGAVTSLTREFGNFTFQHSPTDQLLSSNYSGSRSLPSELFNRTYSLDRTGNRKLAASDAGAPQIANFLVENSTSRMEPDADGLGNLSRKVEKSTGVAETFGYQLDGKLTSYSKDGTVAEYFRDAFGRRVAKKINRTMQGPPGMPTATETFTQSFGYLGDTYQLLLSRAGSGTQFLNLQGQALDDQLGQISNSGQITAYVTNHQGTVLNSIAGGDVVAAFGELPSTALPVASSVANPYQPYFTGKQLDAESGKSNFPERTLDHQTGTWIQRDPVGFAGGDTNLNRYVSNSPMSFVDPTGLVLEKVFVGDRSAYSFIAISSQQFLAHAQGKTLSALQHEEDGGASSILSASGPSDKYRYVRDPGNPAALIDMRHFLVVGPIGEMYGLLIELRQLKDDPGSAFDSQDIYSNALGAQFFKSYDPRLPFDQQLERFFQLRAGKTPSCPLPRKP